MNIPRRKRLIAAAGLVIVLLVVAAALLRSRSSEAGLLLYTTSNWPRAVNLKTGELLAMPGVYADTNRSAPSPDGRWVAQWRQSGDQPLPWELRLFNLQTRRGEALGRFRVRYPTLSWSPDSRRVAFAQSGEGPGSEELVIFDIETGTLEQLTDNNFRDDSPAWSPDGRWLVFTSGEDGYNRLHLFDLQTGERRLLVGDAFGYSPAWSPDGRRIAFASNHESRYMQIYIVRSDGSGLRRITFDETADHDGPVWIR